MIDYIRKSVSTNNITLSKHALQRMTERKIEDTSVYRCIETGIPEKIQDHGRDRQVVFYDKQEDFCVLVAANLPCTVVTVYRKSE